MIGRFLKAFGAIVLLILIGTSLSLYSPDIGFWYGMVLIIVPGYALFRPLPQLYLGNRIFSACVIFFVGAMVAIGAAEQKKGATEVAATPASPDPGFSAPDVRQAASSMPAADAEDARRQQERVERRATEVADRQAAAEARLAAYIEQLDREIASIPSVQISNYTSDRSSIFIGLVLIGAWAKVYEEGEGLDLGEAGQRKRQQFRRLVSQKQAQMLPAMRDAYGPALREQLWEADGSARTIGAGYRTIELVSATFARNANIKKIHEQMRETFDMLRFTRAQYKWFKGASEYTYFEMNPPKDSDIVRWDGGGRFKVLE